MARTTPSLQQAGRTPRPVQTSRAQLDELRAQASRGYPHEVCGLLIGTHGAQSIQVAEITQAKNLATDRLADRYLLDPDDFLAADLRARNAGREIVGVWHTHPDHPARPSQTDLDSAWEGYSYLILSVQDHKVTELTSWWFDGTQFQPQEIQVSEECTP